MSSWCFKKYYHDTGSDQLSAQQKLVLVNADWGYIVSSHGAAMA